MMSNGLDAFRARLRSMIDAEAVRFVERMPISHALHQRARRSMPHGVPMTWMAGLYRHPPLFVAEGSGAYFSDVDENRYLDMNQADLSASLGFAPDCVVAETTRRLRAGSAFLLPTEDAIVVAETLAERSGLPFWQFTGSASTANVELIRLARVATGREQIVLFTGKYHGHADDVLAGQDNGRAVPEMLGVPAWVAERARLVPFNDLPALELALASGDVALVMAEPMLTNCGLVFPDAGYWQQAQALIRKHGSLLVFDEAHSYSFAYGGLTAHWQLAPDAMVIGKGLGSGVAFAAYGMSAELAQVVERHLDVDRGQPGLALGGTTFANALALAAARAALQGCLRQDDYARVNALGKRLSDGLQRIFAQHHLDWRAPHIGGRSGWVLMPDLPRNAEQAMCSLDPDFIDARRLYFANRGVWEAIGSAGPACSFAHTAHDVDGYLAVASEFLAAVVTGT